MDYRPIYHPEISSDLSVIPANIKGRIRKAIEKRLLVDPIGYGLPLRKSLQGYRKLRVGDYRIIYHLEGQDIIILKIGHRRDVYPKILGRLRNSHRPPMYWSTGSTRPNLQLSTVAIPGGFISRPHLDR